jgi:hypothetical protein
MGLEKIGKKRGESECRFPTDTNPSRFRMPPQDFRDYPHHRPRVVEALRRANLGKRASKAKDVQLWAQ